MDWPLHTAETAGRQAAIRAMDVQFDGHRPGIQFEVLRDARNRSVENLSGLSRNRERHLLAQLHFSDICLWNWHDQAQMTAIDDLHNRHCTRLP